ncbi:hypothetical protein J4E76_07960 [Fabibacter sp. E12]|nr:hypothetical protein [Roseivirga sp. E12]
MEEVRTNVYILTEGGANVGFGHIARCYALSQAFQQQGAKAKLVVNGDDSLRKLINEDEYICYDWLNDTKGLLANLDAEEAIFILDSYKVDKAGLDQLAANCPNIAYLDDHGRTDYPKGLILVPINFMHYLDLPYDEDRDMLIGQKYILIRKPFWSATSSVEITEEIKEVMIMMGGMDLKNLSGLALKTISEQFPKATIHLIYNKDKWHIAEWKQRLGDRLKILSGLNANEMCELMCKMDLALITAGQAAYELFCLGIPTIQVSVAENQIWALHAIKEEGYTEHIIDSNGPDYEAYLVLAVKQVRSMEERKKMRKIGRQIVDGQGSMRLAEDIMLYFNRTDHE